MIRSTSPAAYGWCKMKNKFQPDLTEYEIYVMALVDKLNENSIHKMSKTDAVKMEIEKAVKNILPDVEIKPIRKRYVILEM